VRRINAPRRLGGGTISATGIAAGCRVVQPRPAW